MPFQETLSYEDIVAALGYDASTGVFVWLKDVGKNVKAGSEAGSVKATRVDASGRSVSYRYIRLLGRTVPAARLAWLLHYGEWPQGRIAPIDGDTLNLRIENLSQSNAVVRAPADTEGRSEYLRQHRESHPAFWREQHLNDKFGISFQAYCEKVAEQGNRCAICLQQESAVRNDQIKALAVDHDHTTGQVRGLLCQTCNQMVGFSKDTPATLRAAADYLEKHAAVPSNVVPLKEPSA